jgi:ketosteroid isomerase-like protein
MPSANLELVRSLYAAWERADRSSIEWADPGIEFVVADGPAPGSWTGTAEMAEAFREFVSGWTAWHPKAEEYRELDAERVLVLDHFSGRGKASGLDVRHIRTQGAALFHLRGGKVTRLVIYWDRQRGLAELGLGPEPGSPRS